MGDRDDTEAPAGLDVCKVVVRFLPRKRLGMAFRVFLTVLCMFADTDRNYKDFLLKCVLNSIDHIV